VSQAQEYEADYNSLMIMPDFIVREMDDFIWLLFQGRARPGRSVRSEETIRLAADARRDGA